MQRDEGGSLQFEHAEVEARRAAAASCSACRCALAESYYEAAGRVFCARCRDLALAAQDAGSSLARLLRALVFGAAAAVVSAVAWALIVALTGYELGIVAVVVGLAVGGAVRAGAGGGGGWLYQGIAIALTYLAIATSSVPALVGALREQAAEGTAIYASAILLALALPVLQVTEGGIIGLLIVGFALYEAWKINRRQSVAFAGPFRVGSAPGASPI